MIIICCVLLAVVVAFIIGGVLAWMTHTEHDVFGPDNKDTGSAMCYGCNTLQDLIVENIFLKYKVKSTGAPEQNSVYFLSLWYIENLWRKHILPIHNDKQKDVQLSLINH